MTQRQITEPTIVHPVHGILSAYPLAFFSAAFVTDVAYARTAQMQWANFSVWLIAGGVIMGIVAALVGIADAFVGEGRRPRSGSRLHSVVTILALALAVVNGFVHSRDAWTSVVPTGLILSAIVTLLILVSSWLGYSAARPRQGIA